MNAPGWVRLVIVAVCVGGAGCGGGDDPGGAARELRVLVEADPSHLDPRIGNDQASIRVHQLLYNGLVWLDESGLPQAALAEHWEQDDPRTYVFRLRHGIQFHDGRPLTSRDVAWTFESVRDDSIASYLKGDFDVIESIEVVDDLTIRFRLRNPFAPFLIRLTVGIVPDGADGSGSPVGTGPFRFIEYRRGDRIVLEANPGYFRGPPAIPRVQLRIVPEQTSRLLELKKGTADLVYGDLSPDQIGWLREDDRYWVVTGPSWKYDYIGFNLEDPVLADPRVRRAIAHAIDRDSVRRHLLHGQARLATGMLSPDHWAYEASVETYDHDPRRAVELLEAAGYTDPDGDGPRPRLALEYKTSNDEFVRRRAAVFQEQLRQVGVELEVRTYEWATFYEDIRAGRFQVFSLTWTGVDDPDWYRFRFDSESIPPRGANRSRYRNPDLDHLLEAGSRETGMDLRRRIYSEVQRILADDLPEIPLWHRDEIAVIKRDLEGFRLTPNGDFAVLGEMRRRLP
jgi:peptide/nickel transport system substrate-binding protein